MEDTSDIPQVTPPSDRFFEIQALGLTILVKDPTELGPESWPNDRNMFFKNAWVITVVPQGGKARMNIERQPDGMFINMGAAGAIRPQKDDSILTPIRAQMAGITLPPAPGLIVPPNS
jgi:hypothetical protein